MEVEELHKARRMWAVVDGRLLVAPAGSAQSHAEWLDAAVGEERSAAVLAHAPRGFVRDGTLYAYVGDFDVLHAAELDALRHHLPSLARLTGLSADALVYSGLVRGRLGEFWPGRVLLGPLGLIAPR